MRTRYVGALGVVAALVLSLGAAVVFLLVMEREASYKLDTATAALAQREASAAALEQANSTLLSDKTRLEVYLEEARSRYDGVSSENVSLQSRLVQEEAVSAQLRVDLSSMTLKNAELALARDALAAARDDLESDHAALAAQHKTLAEEYDAIVKLHGTIPELEERIAQLEERLKPLLGAVGRQRSSWFACTGSMEPQITCLDRVHLAPPTDPEDIVVGVVINVDPHCGEGDGDGRGVAHRVTAIKVRNGVHYYATKGDAIGAVDTCWIPYSDVLEYLIAVDKDVYPENAELRDQVNSALAAFRAEQVKVDAVERRYLAARETYFALIEQICGEGVSFGNCPRMTDAQEQQIRASFDHSEDLYDEFRAASRELSAARRHWECWYRNAERSLGPGHIPHPCP